MDPFRGTSETGSCCRRRRSQHTRPCVVARSDAALPVHRLDREHRRAALGRPNRSRVPPLIMSTAPAGRHAYHRHTCYTPPFQVHGDGVDGTRSTVRGPMASPSVNKLFRSMGTGATAPANNTWTTDRKLDHLSPLVCCRVRPAVRLAHFPYTTYLVSGSRPATRSLHFFDDGTVLIKRTPPCRPLTLTWKILTSSRDQTSFTMPPGCLTPPQPSMSVLDRSGAHNQVELDTPECMHHRG